MNDQELHIWVEKLSLPVLEGGSAVSVKMNNSNLFSILVIRQLLLATCPDCLSIEPFSIFREFGGTGKLVL